MKVLNQLLAVGLFALLAGCGGGSSNTTAAQSQCQNGAAYSTQYGQCLQQSYCPSGQGLYNNTCVTTGTTTGSNGYVGVTCSEGQLVSQVGNTCMPRGNCQLGQGVLNNSCQPGAAYGACNANFVYSQNYGCITQNGCPSGQGMSPQGCVTATNSNTGYNNGYNNGYPNNNNNNGYNNGYNNGNNGVNNCPSGTFNTTNGCLPQGPCMYGQVLYNNQCYYLVQQGNRYWNSNTGGGFGFQIHFGL